MLRKLLEGSLSFLPGEVVGVEVKSFPDEHRFFFFFLNSFYLFFFFMLLLIYFQKKITGRGLQIRNGKNYQGTRSFFVELRKVYPKQRK